MRLTEEESRQYYARHPEAFMKPATLVLREIVVNIATRPDPTTGQPSINAAEADEAKERISKARARVLAGEDFAKVAGEVSEGGSKANGGLVGTVVVDEMVPALRDTLNKLKPKEVSEPIRLSTGYRIYQGRFAVGSAGPAVRGSPRHDHPEDLSGARRRRAAEIRRETAGPGGDRVEGRRTTGSSTRRRCSRAGRPASRKNRPDGPSQEPLNEDRQPHPRPSGRARADGRHDGHGVPPAREGHGRVRTRGHRDGELRGARPRHRSHARIRGVHRSRTAGVDSDLRRRSEGDGRRRADRRRHGRRHRRHQHGLPGAEDRQAQRRLQPDARAGARRRASSARWRARCGFR